MKKVRWIESACKSVVELPSVHNTKSELYFEVRRKCLGEFIAYRKLLFAKGTIHLIVHIALLISRN